MGWETRGGDKKYFYRSVRLSDGRRRKKYIGNGMLAEVESLWLERKAAVRRQLSEERQQTAAAESLLKRHLRSTSDVTHSLMLSIGYANQRSRGWRTLKMIDANTINDENVPTATEDYEPTFGDLREAASQGDRTAIPALRRILRQHPEYIWSCGDLASQTQLQWIDLIAGQNLFWRECLLLKMAEHKRDLMAETNGTVVEKMLVDQSIATWLQLYFHEGREAKSPADNVQISEHRLKKIESAFNRHMKSLNALASMKSINFTKSMVEAMKSVTQDVDDDQSESASSPVVQPTHNRFRDSFSRAFESAPMN